LHKILGMSVKSIIKASIEAKQNLLASELQVSNITEAASICCNSLKNGGKILLCGNGGSAADAQHIAAELSGRFNYNRPALYAEALHVNSSFMTAVANDFGFEKVYSRMIEAAGHKGDVLIAISTSGRSPNILAALSAAASKGMKVIGLTGQDGRAMREHCHLLIETPSGDTARIQEMHILVGHILCQIIESEIFPKKD
jgi:D-sedoheptulose 7-phosphate isomerase